VLLIVTRYGSLTAKDISHGATMDKAWVSRAVATLLQRRLLKRERDDADRRKQILSPTTAGKALYNKIRPIARKRQARILGSLDHEELEALDRILIKLGAFAETYAGE
jgi:DNA-binding MarR family transcriptional regulator